MGPRISVRRKGDDLFLTLEGDFNCDSSQEMLSAMRELFMTSLKCAAPGSQVTYTLKTHGKVDLDKMNQWQQVGSNVQDCGPSPLEERQASQEQVSGPVQGDYLNRQARGRLMLIKGGGA